MYMQQVQISALFLYWKIIVILILNVVDIQDAEECWTQLLYTLSQRLQPTEDGRYHDACIIQTSLLVI